MEQNIEWNPTNPQKSDHSLPELVIQFFLFNLSIYHFILNLSYSLPENNFAIFPRKALLWHGTAERKEEWKKEKKIEYCCTIPY